MSAEPDLVHPGDGSHISAAAQRSRGEVLRVQTATSSAVLEFDRPQIRSRALPLVHNRADRAQVDAFYAELREATQAGNVKFANGIDERKRRRLVARARSSRVRVVGDEILEPMSHSEFMTAVRDFVHKLGEVADDYDSDELEADRVALFQSTREKWHFESRRDKLPRMSRAGTPGVDESDWSSHSPTCRPEMTLEAPVAALSLRYGAQDHLDSSKGHLVGPEDEHYLLSDDTSPQKAGRLSETDSQIGRQLGSEIQLSQEAINQHNREIDAFGRLGLAPDPKTVDLRMRHGVITTENMEAIVELFTPAKGLVAPDTLLLSGCTLGGIGIDALAPFLSSCISLKTLDLSQNNLCTRSAQTLSLVLKELPHLSKVVFDDNQICSRGTQALMATFRGAVNLQEINLKRCEIFDRGASYVAQALHPAYWNKQLRDDLIVEKRKSLLYNPGAKGAHGAGLADFFLGTSLTSLNLCDNQIGPNGAVALLTSMAWFCSNLRDLDLSQNSITAGGQDYRGATALCETLKQATGLVSLNLGDCKLQSEGGGLVVEGLMNKTKQLQREIKDLWYDLGKTRDVSVATRQRLEQQVAEREKEFGAYIMKRDLRSLKLPRNNLGPTGILALGEARNLFPSLTELDISSNEITGNNYDTSFDASSRLCDALKPARKIAVLSLADNRLGAPKSADEAKVQPLLHELSAALMNMRSITRLDLAKNMIGVSGSQTIAGALDMLRKLVYLDLSQNMVGSDGMKILAPSLRPMLSEITFADNDIGPDGTNALALRVPFLTNLTRLDLSGNKMTQALKASAIGAGGRSKFLLSSVASQLGSSGLGEARKQLLMTRSGSGVGSEVKRGLPALAAACAQNLIKLREIVVVKSLNVRTIRSAQPTLDLSMVDFQLQDMTFVSEMLKQNTAVTSVNLSQNDLNEAGSTLAEWMRDAVQLKCLNLSDTKLGYNVLTASEHGIESIAVGLSPLFNLTELNLSNNKIGTDGLKYLSPAIKTLSELRILDISHNPITFRHKGHTGGDNYYTGGVMGFAESLMFCVKLEILDLSQCNLKDEGSVVISNAVQQLTNLQKVNLQANSIEPNGQEALGHALRKCRNMTATDNICSNEILAGEHLSISAIYQVSFIANCFRRDAVSKIDLSDNFLGRSTDTIIDLMQGLGTLRTLTDLNLSGNKPFSNEVSQTLAESLKNMTSLRSLQVANNAISGAGADAIMCSLLRLFQIEEIDLSRNAFKTFPVAISISCPILWKMNLSENPWTNPPRSLMQKNSGLIRDTLNMQFLNGTIDREMALIFVGDGETGKTSVIQALMSDQGISQHIALDDRTRAIQLSTWHPQASPQSPIFNIYDFAGTPIYKNMQLSLCLLRRALYCLTWRPFRRLTESERPPRAPGAPADSTDAVYRVRSHGLCTRAEIVPHLQRQVTEWISTLYRRIPGFYFLLIATQADMVGEDDLAWQANVVEEAVATQLSALRERYSYVAAANLLNSGESVRVSAKTGANIAHLTKVLIRETRLLPFFGEILPQTWMKARQTVLTIRNMHRAVLRARKKDAKSLNQDHILESETADTHQTPGCFDQPDSDAEISEDEDSAMENEEGLQQKFKVWQAFAMRTMLRVRLKRMMNVTPELAKGFMWIGHLKSLLSKAGVHQSQHLYVMRYFHDAGWIRCYGFDDTKLSKVRSNEHDPGFEMLDPFRSAGFKLATNSYAGLHRKDAHDRHVDTSEEAWIDMCDTVFLDMQWLFNMTHAIVTHDGTQTIASQPSTQLRSEALALYNRGELKWSPGTSSLLGKLWRALLSDHEFRKVRHVLEAKSILSAPTADGIIQVHCLKKRINPPCTLRRHAVAQNVLTEDSNDAPVKSLPSSTFLTEDGNESFSRADRKQRNSPLGAERVHAAECFAFLSHDKTNMSPDSKEVNYARNIVPILRHTVQSIAMASMLECTDFETEEAIDEALGLCSIFIVCVSDAHMRSKTGRYQIAKALDLGLHVIAVILPSYSIWPPALGDGCWWDFAGELRHLADYLYLATLVDLSMPQYLLYYKLISKAQEEEMGEGSEPQTPAPVWQALKDGEYDEDDVDLKDEVSMQSELLQLSRESVLEHRALNLSSFVRSLESVAVRVMQIFHRHSIFLPDLSDGERKVRHELAKRLIKKWDNATVKMEQAAVAQAELRQQVRIAKEAEEEELKRMSQAQHDRLVQQSRLWRIDPLQAKIALLKDIASVTKGIGANAVPKWQNKQEIIAKSQEIAAEIWKEKKEGDALANHAAQGLTKVHPEDNSGACNDAQLTSEDDAQVDMLSEREQMEITETTMPQAGSGMIGTVCDASSPEISTDAASPHLARNTSQSSLTAGSTNSADIPRNTSHLSLTTSHSDSADPAQPHLDLDKCEDTFLELVGHGSAEHEAGERQRPTPRATPRINDDKIYGTMMGYSPGAAVKAVPFVQDILRAEMTGMALNRGLTLSALQAAQSRTKLSADLHTAAGVAKDLCNKAAV